MVLLDERTEPAVQMIARQVGGPSAPGTTGIALRGKDGRIRAIEP
jgi:hypothetical protein